MKPTDEAKRLRDEIYHVYAFTTEGELSCTDATHAIDADDLPAIISKVLDAVVDNIIEYGGRDSKMNYLKIVAKLRP